jgi:hypothetical protein
MAHIHLMYYQYEVTFSPYVMTTAEKWVLNTIVVSFLALLALGIISYLPPLLTRVGSRVFWLYNSSSDELMLNITASMWNDLAHEKVQ